MESRIADTQTRRHTEADTTCSNGIRKNIHKTIVDIHPVIRYIRPAIQLMSYNPRIQSNTLTPRCVPVHFICSNSILTIIAKSFPLNGLYVSCTYLNRKLSFVLIHYVYLPGYFFL